jgi:hypothetical protein
MHVFAIALVLGLAVMTLTTWLGRFMPRAEPFSAIAMAVLGVLGAWLADFDLWQLWDVPVRAHWIGIVLTGLALGGIAYAWHELVSLAASLARKTTDEAKAIEYSQTIRAA